MLDRQVLVAQGVPLALRLVEHVPRPPRQLGAGPAIVVGQLGERFFQPVAQGEVGGAHPGQHRQHRCALLAQESDKEMVRGDLGVVAAPCAR